MYIEVKAYTWIHRYIHTHIYAQCIFSMYDSSSCSHARLHFVYLNSTRDRKYYLSTLVLLYTSRARELGVWEDWGTEGRGRPAPNGRRGLTEGVGGGSRRRKGCGRPASPVNHVATGKLLAPRLFPSIAREFSVRCPVSKLFRPYVCIPRVRENALQFEKILLWKTLTRI